VRVHAPHCILLDRHVLDMIRLKSSTRCLKLQALLRFHLIVIVGIIGYLKLPTFQRRVNSNRNVTLISYVCWGPSRQAGCLQLPKACGQQSHTRKIVENKSTLTPDWVSCSILNKKKYAKLHGYDFIMASDRAYTNHSRARAWGVINAIRDHVKICEQRSDESWFMYLDTDTFITNFELGIESYLLSKVSSSAQIVFTEDWNGLNSGVILCRCSKSTLNFWNEVWNVDHYTTVDFFHPFTFQLGIVNLIKAHPHWQDLIQILPQRQMNSYPLQTPGLEDAEMSAWHQGDFIIHFAGCGDNPNRNCDEEMAPYIESTVNAYYASHKNTV